MRRILLSTFVLVTAVRPPNIIFLQTDSMDGRLVDTTSEYYYKINTNMPFKKKLVDGGINFVRAYANSPQCVPSRTSMFTSRYPHEIWTGNNGQGLARSTLTGQLDRNCVRLWSRDTCEMFAWRQRQVTDTILDVMRKAGYQLHLFGRFDVGAGILQDYSNSTGNHTTGDGFHGGPDITILARGAGVLGRQAENPLNTTRTTAKHPYASDVKHTREAMKWLKSNTPPGATDPPFFFWLGLLAPHPVYHTSEQYLKHVNVSAVDAPPSTPVSGMCAYDRSQTVLKSCDHLYTDADLKNMRSAYWGMCAEAFLLLDKFLTVAKKRGFLDNTWVIYTSDHGEMSMEHSQQWKNSMYEPSARVPLIFTPFNIPGLRKVSKHVITQHVSLIDVLPTLAELANYKLNFVVRGQSLVPYLYGTATNKTHKDYVAMEYHGNYATTGSFALRQGDLKLVTFGHNYPWFNESAYPPRLFNLTNDPFELRDIGPNHTLVQSMIATLESELGMPLESIDELQLQDNLNLYQRFLVGNCNNISLWRVWNQSWGLHLDPDRVKQWSGSFEGRGKNNCTNKKAED